MNLGQPYRKVPILNERSQRHPQVPCTKIQDAKMNEHKSSAGLGQERQFPQRGTCPLPHLQAELSTLTRMITTYHPCRGEQMLLSSALTCPSETAGTVRQPWPVRDTFKPESAKHRLL